MGHGKYLVPYPAHRKHSRKASHHEIKDREAKIYKSRGSSQTWNLENLNSSYVAPELKGFQHSVTLPSLFQCGYWREEGTLSCFCIRRSRFVEGETLLAVERRLCL